MIILPYFTLKYLKTPNFNFFPAELSGACSCSQLALCDSTFEVPTFKFKNFKEEVDTRVNFFGNIYLSTFINFFLACCEHACLRQYFQGQLCHTWTKNVKEIWPSNIVILVSFCFPLYFRLHVGCFVISFWELFCVFLSAFVFVLFIIFFLHVACFVISFWELYCVFVDLCTFFFFVYKLCMFFDFKFQNIKISNIKYYYKIYIINYEFKTKILAYRSFLKLSRFSHSLFSKYKIFENLPLFFGAHPPAKKIKARIGNILNMFIFWIWNRNIIIVS